MRHVGPPAQDNPVFDSGNTGKGRPASIEMIGKVGRTITDLTATGRIEIGGQVYSAMSKHGFLKENVNVRVVARKMSYLVVVAA